MKKYSFSFLILMIFAVAIFIALPAEASNRIDLNVDKTRVTLGDVLRLDVTMTLEDEGSVSDIVQPKMDGFKVLSQNTSHQSYTSIVNFKMTSKKTVTTTYILQPTKLGNLVIGPASLKDKGKLVESNKISITIAELKAQGGKQFYGDNALAAPLSDNENRNPAIFFRLVPEKSEVFVGEQMAVTLFLYSSGQRISRWAPVAPSTFTGFSSRRLELPKNKQIKNVIINRSQYRVEPLDRFLLTARQVGSFTFTPYQAKVLDQGRSFFGGQWQSFSAPPVEVTIKPLPENGKPANFNSAHVGNFNITARVDRRQTETGQPVTLVVTLVANTELERIMIPKLPNIKGVKVYPPTMKNEAYQKGTRFIGKSVAEYLIVPNNVGMFKIPPIVFDYFDTQKNTYRKLRTAQYTIRAVQGENTPASANGNLAQVAKQDLTFDEASLRPLHPSSRNYSGNGQFVGSLIFNVLLFGGIFIVFAVLLVDLLRFILPKIFESEKAIMERELKRVSLEISAKTGDKLSDIASDLRQWIYLALEYNFGEPMAGLTNEAIYTKLQKYEADEELLKELKAIFEALDMATYVESSGGSSPEFYTRVQTWIGRLRS